MLSIITIALYAICIFADIYIGNNHLAFPIDIPHLFFYIAPFILVLIILILSMKTFKKEHRKNILLIISMCQILIHTFGYMH